jgi:hypothetical protein
MTATVSRFEGRLAPCGANRSGEAFLTEDHEGLTTEELLFACGCKISKEEFHDGSVHRMVVNHHGKVLTDEELRGE